MNDSLPSITTVSPHTIVASGVPDDDLAVRNDGPAYIGANPVNTVFKSSPSGVVNIVAGGMTETVMAGAASRPLGGTREIEHYFM